MELITIPKSWVENKIKGLKQNPELPSILNRIRLLEELLENSKSAEEVFDAGRKEEWKDITFDGGENYETVNVRVFETYQDYLKSLT